MKKISFAAFGAVFGGGLVVGGADASIISRGFLDEALESYATTTALDLKANQSDLTNLSNKIGNAWPYMFDMAPGLYALSWGLYPQEMNLENTSDLVRFLFGGQIESGINEGGVLNALGQSVYDTGAYDIKTGQMDDGFRSLTQLTNGWTDSQRKTYLGVRGLNDMIANNLGTVILYDPNPKSTTGYIKVPTTDLYEVLGFSNNFDLLRFPFAGQVVETNAGATLMPLWKLTQSAYKTEELSTKIGTLPEGITVEGLYQGWISPVTGKHTLGLLNMEQDYFTAYNPTTDSVQEVELGKGGLLYMLSMLLMDYGYADGEGNILAPFWKLTQSAYKTDELSTKIGTLPSGAMPEAPVWSDKLFQHMYQEYGVEPIYPTSLAGLMELLFGSSQKDSTGILQRMVAGIPENDGTDNLIGLYPNYVLAKEANDKIGTLPTKTFDIGNGGFSEMFSDGKSFPVTIPSGYTLSDLFLDLYTSGSPLPSISDVAYITMHGGELSQYWADVHGIEQYKGLLNLTKDIGTLPTGELPRVPFWTDTLLPALGIEPNYPTSLAGLMELLFGNNAHAGILPLIYRGVTVDTDGNGGRDTNIGIVSNYQLATSANATANAASTAAQTAQTTANTAKSTADSAIEKIGRLPTEYSTVGAALSAMDAKIDAHELPADSDDGQYVLSAKKVGDTITYTWVKMDLTDAEK